VLPQVQQYLNPATNPYTPVFQQSAQQNPEQLSAVGNYNTAFGAANTGLGTYGEAQSLAEGAAQPLTQAEIDQYFNPYVNDVVNAAQRQFTLQNAQQQNQVVGNETAQGALGGNRTAVAGALTAGQQAAAEDPIIAGMLQAGYTQQEAMAAQQYQQIPLAAASALQGIGAGQEGAAGNIANLGMGQYGLGTQQQQYYTPGAPTTATLNALYAEQLAKYGYPIQLTNMAAGDIGGLAAAYGTNTTTTPPPPSLISGLAGAGTFGLGLGALGQAGAFAPLAAMISTGGRVQGRRAGGAVLPESPRTLHAQQRQLLEGHRRVQMFPHGSKELSLPSGMRRVEAHSGVFHYNPDKVSEAEIHKHAKAGTEHHLLDLGPYSKQDIMHRVRGGEAPVAVVERHPDGTEVRAAVGTRVTAAEQAAHMERTKSPGHRIHVEDVRHTLAKRADGGRVQGLLTGGVPAMPYGASPMSGLGPVPYAGGGSYVPQGAVVNIPRPQAAPPMPEQQDDASKMFTQALQMSKLGSGSGSGPGLATTLANKFDPFSEADLNYAAEMSSAGGRVPRAYGGLATPSSNRINVPMRGGFGMPSFMSRGGLAEGGTPDDDIATAGLVAAADTGLASEFAGPPQQVAALNTPATAPAASGPTPGLVAAPPVTADVPLPQPRPKEADEPPKPWRVAANEWTKAGMSENGVAGVLANVKDESNFDSTLRHPDQPHWGGEAHFAHGLYQEGGQEWNNYANWLRNTHPGADWRDPKLQSEFTAQNLKNNYPQVWDKMANAKTKEEAAQAFVSGYLKPAAHFENARLSKYAAGVPDSEDYEKMAFNTTPVGQQRGLMTTTTDAGGIPGVTPIKASDISGKAKPDKTDIALSLMAAGLGMMGSRSPYAGVGIGQGGLQGIGTYEALHKQRVGEAEHQAQLEMNAAALNQHPQMQQLLFAQQKAQQERLFAQQQQMEEKKAADVRALEAMKESKQPRTIVDSQTGMVRNVVPRGDGTFEDIMTHDVIGTPRGQTPTPTQTPRNPTQPMPSNPRNASVTAPTQLVSADPGFRVRNSQFVESGQSFNYASGDTPHIEKGMVVPEPQAIGGNSVDSLKTDAKTYLQTGKLPPVSRGASPVAVSQQAYQRAVKNYANAVASSLGMTHDQVAETMRQGGMMPRFILGPAGQATVSLGTAVRHLDTLREFAKAWDANDVQTVNRLRTTISREFGDDAATNLDTVGKIVGPEIIKAIGVAGAGTAEERAGAAAQFSTIASGKQMLGAIDVTQKLLSGQLEGKKRQAAASGVSEETFKNLIGDRPYEILTGIDKGTTKETEGAQAAPSAPKVGDVVKGYKFKGGNPSDKNNWEKQ
jgi:hypothetical protein